ncbi:YjgN family protein [Hydrogenophaga sp.]|uniref:YjgN family protein n=1 Tax=Hydrogenophaga sp. TaxID=1904254 RepID=UPI003F6F2114
MDSLDKSRVSAQSLILPIRFTGSGREYFRIWIVNAVLTLLTLTLYQPFARARRLSYFYSHTVVGEDSLNFHGDPWKMFRGYLLVVSLSALTWGVLRYAPQLSWVILLAFAVISPWLWRASIRFRLQNTSWRGVRLGFKGDLKGAYLCTVPFFFAVAAFAGLLTATATRADRSALLIMAFLGFAVVLPYLMTRVYRYRFTGMHYALQSSRLDLEGRDVYAVSVNALFVIAGCSVFAGILAVALGLAIEGLANREGVLVFIVSASGVLGYLVYPFVAAPYVVARRQNLIWSQVRSTRFRFSSHLSARSFVALTAANALLVVLTIGLYWPYAQLRYARLRLESVKLQVEGELMPLQVHGRSNIQGELGDGVVDFLGLDVGL